jgi:hypothetical protein
MLQMYSSKVITATFEPCSFSVEPPDAEPPAGGGGGIVAVTAAAPHCAWSASTDVDWISITEGNSGAGDGQVSYTVAPNPDVEARKGTVTVAGLVVAVRQEGISLPLLAVRLGGTGLGEVVSDPPGIDCGFDCGAYFAEGATVVLTARPGKEDTFAGWGGACSGTGPCSVKMDSRKAVMAFFERLDERVVYDWSYTYSSGEWSGMAPSAVKSLPNVAALGSGGNGAVTSDGRIWEWDLLNDPRAYPRMDLEQVAAYSSRGDRGIALKPDGTVWEWKDGYGAFAARKVGGLADITAVDDGGAHFLALASDGTVWSWGENGEGQLGDGTEIERSTPGKVLNLSNVIAISAGGNASLALKADGTVWAWGLYSAGYIYQKNTKSLVPVRLAALSRIVAISAGLDLGALALASDGTVWSWGMNTYGQLGDGSTRFRTGPGKVKDLTDVVAIGAGSGHSLALKSDGTVWAWGHNWYGGTGNNPYEDSLLPRQVPGLDHIKSITASGGRSVALRTARRLTLTVTKAGSGIGTVTGTPGGIDCGESCSATYDDGTMVTLTATPQSGSYLASWSKPCGKSTTCTITMENSTEVTATFEPIPPCTYTVKPAEKSFPAKGGSTSVSVTGTGDHCIAPELNPSAPWITAETISFSDNKGTVKISVPENKSSLKRSGTVAIGNTLFTFTQQGTPCKITNLTPSTASYASAGGNGTFAVSTPEGCSWTAAPEKGSSSSWLTVASGGTGTGPGSVSYTVGSNATTKDRTGKITVSLVGATGRKSFTVRQVK